MQRQFSCSFLLSDKNSVAEQTAPNVSQRMSFYASHSSPCEPRNAALPFTVTLASLCAMPRTDAQPGTVRLKRLNKDLRGRAQARRHTHRLCRTSFMQRIIPYSEIDL